MSSVWADLNEYFAPPALLELSYRADVDPATNLLGRRHSLWALDETDVEWIYRGVGDFDRFKLIPSAYRDREFELGHVPLRLQENATKMVQHSLCSR